MDEVKFYEQQCLDIYKTMGDLQARVGKLKDKPKKTYEEETELRLKEQLIEESRRQLSPKLAKIGELMVEASNQQGEWNNQQQVWIDQQGGWGGNQQGWSGNQQASSGSYLDQKFVADRHFENYSYGKNAESGLGTYCLGNDGTFGKNYTNAWLGDRKGFSLMDNLPNNASRGKRGVSFVTPENERKYIEFGKKGTTFDKTADQGYIRSSSFDASLSNKNGLGYGNGPMFSKMSSYETRPPVRKGAQPSKKIPPSSTNYRAYDSSGRAFQRKSPDYDRKIAEDMLPKVIMCGLNSNNQPRLIFCDNRKLQNKDRSTTSY